MFDISHTIQTNDRLNIMRRTGPEKPSTMHVEVVTALASTPISSTLKTALCSMLEIRALPEDFII